MRRRLLPVRLAALALLAASCGAADTGSSSTTSSAVPPSAPVDDATAHLATARASWAEAGSDAYRYTFTDRCGECGPEARTPYEVNVHEGRALPGAGTGRTVEALFDAIGDAIGEGLTTIVEYDQDLGVPIHVVIDPESFPVDGGTEWIITDFVMGEPGTKLTDVEIEEAVAQWGRFGFTEYSFTEHIYCDCADAGSTPLTVVGDSILEAGAYSDRELFPITFDELLEGLVLFNEEADELETVSLDYLVRLDPVHGYVSWIWVDAELDDGERIEFVMRFTDFAPGPSPSPTVSTLAEEEYLAALDDWRRLGITDYRYTLSVGCFCPEEFRGPFEVTVEDDEITSVTRNGEVVDPGLGYTITQIYDLIAEHLAKGVRNSVTYDEQGVPMSVQLDLDAMAVDGGTSLDVSDFTPLGNEQVAAALKLAQTQWEAAGIDTYTVYYLFACECPGGNISVEVVDGVVESATFSDASADDEVLDGLLYPIHRMFGAIAGAIDRGAHSIDAEFHPTLGHPTSIIIDYDRDTADEELIILDIRVEPA